MTRQVSFTIDGQAVTVVASAGSLLDALRDHLGVSCVKDGCSPQGQCGCCTVLVGDEARVACVTPLARVAGRDVTTAAGLTGEERERWSRAFLDSGASQCGFCSPGIVMRLVSHERRGADLTDAGVVQRALAAHLCRCTGWQTIVEAAALAAGRAAGHGPDGGVVGPDVGRATASQRAALETGATQQVGAASVLGVQPFADDRAPAGALVAVRRTDGTYATASTLAAARTAAGKVQGRRSGTTAEPPIAVPLPPEGTEWAVTLSTCWVEPAYVESDASWCEPGGEPASPLANGGAFGGKAASPVGDVARQLADEHGQPVRVLWSREDCTQLGPKRPPLAAGLAADGTGTVRVARTAGAAEVIRRVLPLVSVEEVDVAGPPTSLALRAACWAEAEMLAAGLRLRASGTASPRAASSAGDLSGCEEPDVQAGSGWIVDPELGAQASATVTDAGIEILVVAGDPLSETMLRSYCIGAAHMAYSWVTSEALCVDADGTVRDLTIRSFGVLSAADTPRVTVTLADAPGTPTDVGAKRVSDAAFVAVAVATWLYLGCPERLPAGDRQPEQVANQVGN